MRLCKDCKYSEQDAIDKKLNFYRCIAPQNMEKPDAVDGSQKPRWKWCDLHRKEGRFLSFVLRTCGRRGRWFEPKEGS